METNRYYEEYWSKEGFNPRGSTGRGLERLLSANVTPGRWLDVGCGDGRSAGLWLRAHGCEYVGVDISSTAVEQARQFGLDVQQIESAEELPFPDGDFDGVVCIEVLEHVFRPDVILTEIRRVLRPGGRLIVTVPTWPTGTSGSSSCAASGIPAATTARPRRPGAIRMCASSRPARSPGCS